MFESWQNSTVIHKFYCFIHWARFMGYFWKIWNFGWFEDNEALPNFAQFIRNFWQIRIRVSCILISLALPKFCHFAKNFSFLDFLIIFACYKLYYFMAFCLLQIEIKFKYKMLEWVKVAIIFIIADNSCVIFGFAGKLPHIAWLFRLF